MAEAGKPGAVTVPLTAGRGTDIKLGGNKDFIEDGVIDEDEHKKNELRVKELADFILLELDTKVEN